MIVGRKVTTFDKILERNIVVTLARAGSTGLFRVFLNTSGSVCELPKFVNEL